MRTNYSNQLKTNDNAFVEVSTTGVIKMPHGTAAALSPNLWGYFPKGYRESTV